MFYATCYNILTYCAAIYSIKSDVFFKGDTSTAAYPQGHKTPQLIQTGYKLNQPTPLGHRLPILSTHPSNNRKQISILPPSFAWDRFLGLFSWYWSRTNNSLKMLKWIWSVDFSHIKLKKYVIFTSFKSNRIRFQRRIAKKISRFYCFVHVKIKIACLLINLLRFPSFILPFVPKKGRQRENIP